MDPDPASRERDPALREPKFLILHSKFSIPSQVE